MKKLEETHWKNAKDPNDVTHTDASNLHAALYNSFALPCGRESTVHHACRVSRKPLLRAQYLVGRSPSRDSLCWTSGFATLPWRYGPARD